MAEALKVLLVEDSARDAELLSRELKRAAIECECRRVQTQADFERELKARPHVILSDFSMPGFSGKTALAIWQKSGLDIPFIFVSGTIGEDVAVEAMRAGAHDYVMKANLAKLGPAIRRELREAEMRRRSRVAEAGLQRAQQMARLAHVITAPDGSFETWSDTLPQLLGVPAAQLPASTRQWLGLLHPDDQPRFRVAAIEADHRHERRDVEYRLRRPDGTWVHVRQTMEPLDADRDAGGRSRWFNTLQDVSEQRRAEESLHRFRLALDNSADLVFIVDRAAMRIVDVNQAACHLLGYSREELLRMGPQDILPVSREALEKAYDELIANPALRSGMTSYYRCKDGSRLPFESTRRALRSGDRWLVVAVSRDIRERLAAEEKVRHLTRVQTVLSEINALIVRVRDRDELLREACRIAVEAGGFPKAWIGLTERHSQAVTMVAAHGADARFFENLRAQLKEDAAQGGGVVALASRQRQPVVSNDLMNDARVLGRENAAATGSRSLVVLPLLVAGEVAGVLVLHADVAGFFDDAEMKLLRELAGDIAFAIEHIAKSERLDYLAYYDSLTGLANRTLFLERVEQQVAAARNAQQKLAVFLLDIERFKAINDAFGHQAGDALLKQVAERMLRAGADPTRVARIGADHFGVMGVDMKSEEQIARLTESRLKELFDQPFALADSELRVSGKVGIAVFPSDGADAESLFRNAEAALKKSKASGERYLFHTAELTARVAERLSLESKLRQALEREEFVLHYQPKVDLASGGIVGVEALIRWQSPELGLVPPGRFIPLLEETGLILPVGSWALKRASLEHRGWTERKLKPPRVAVNVSPIQLRRRDFVSAVEQAIMEGVAPVGVDLEITESLLMEDVPANIEKLKAVRALGINIAIDDFGTGYSSLGYLAKLPVQALKIDRSFIITMNADPDALTLVSTMISLAHALRLKVVAEGVDSEDQAKFLRLLRCDEMQGYLFSKPLPAEELVKLLTKS